MKSKGMWSTKVERMTYYIILKKGLRRKIPPVWRSCHAHWRSAWRICWKCKCRMKVDGVSSHLLRRLCLILWMEKCAWMICWKCKWWMEGDGVSSHLLRRLCLILRMEKSVVAYASYYIMIALGIICCNLEWRSWS